METSTQTMQSYLTFRLAEELFATNVNKVLEILEIPKITKVPHSPVFMRGVINLRGSVLPVIDARAKFGMNETQDTVNSCIMVLEVNTQDQTITIGAVVDSVQEVMEINSVDIQPAPSIGLRYRSEFIDGMVKSNEGFIMMLDLAKVLSTEDATILQQMSDLV